MELITILNRRHRFKGFIYQYARFTPDRKTIDISVRPRKGSAGIPRFHEPAPGYDQLADGVSSSFPLLVFSSSSSMATEYGANCRRRDPLQTLMLILVICGCFRRSTLHGVGTGNRSAA